MYGMVNHGVQTLIIEKFGQADWEDICRMVGLSDTNFEGMITYPDSITYDLVGAISKKYDMPPDQVLDIFGDFWVDYSSETVIGKLFDFGGREIMEFLDSLNEMHERIKLSMPHLKPPIFEFEEGEANTHVLHYSSDREGLEPMVVGLLRGLGRKHKVAIDVVQHDQPAYDGVRASFSLTIN